MKDKIFSTIGTVLSLSFIIGVFIFLNYFEEVIESIFGVVAIILGIIFLIAFLAFLFNITKKWLTIGLDVGEKDTAVIILAIIVYGAIFTGLIKIIHTYQEEIETGLWYLLKIFIGSVILLVPLIFLYRRFGNSFKKKINSINVSSELLEIILSLSIPLILSIVIEYFFGDNIIAWLKNYWFYLLVGFIITTIIMSIIEKKRKPNL